MYSLDNLRPQRTTFWTVQPAPALAEAIQARNDAVTVANQIDNEIDEAKQAGDESAQAQAASLAETRIQLAQEIAELERSIGSEHLTLQIRITIRGYSSLALSAYTTLSAEASLFYEERTGEPMATLEERPDPAKAEIANACLNWSRAIPAIEKIETRPISLFELEPDDYTGDDGWEEQEIPESWQAIDTALDAIPYRLLQRIAHEARVANSDIAYPLHTPTTRRAQIDVGESSK